VPLSLKNKYSRVEWKKIAGMRDILAHEYFGVDLEILWRAVKRKIVPLGKTIRKIIEKETKQTLL
jgi:uncharacterized protein with HEPN domain